MRYISLSAAALFTMAGTAQADVLSAGALFGSPTQTTAVCYVYNSGNAAISINSFVITGQNGNSITLNANECGTFPVALGGGKSCGIGGAVNNQPYNCKVNVSNKANTRGVFEIRNSSGTSITNVVLQ